ncbi:ADP-ribose pyrophosphatase [Bifidobacterium margollesii]|uniref:ADP-ribose pyrophosphatase n=1 Tax=Bifidobacterium margollesii TaxID=2020964 RepID=A0A2N5J959_9BIFI|nr:NUDIX hydrolase family protein [Bifidobacterium margollesii]PLS30748.1 ADP-ribose pyrophosphatase [Bifidobacterium margollesii]
MPVLNDEVPDEGDYDASRRRGEFDNITPDDFIRGSGAGNPPGWLDAFDIDHIRHQLPIVYVEIVPVRTDEFGRIAKVGTLLRVGDDGAIERTLITGRVLFHESLREAVARNISKDLGDIALPMFPVSLQPFTVAEFFPTPGVSEFYDPRQHAVALCYVVPIAGDCKPQDETLDVEWVSAEDAVRPDFISQLSNGHGTVLRRALAWASLG